MKYRVYSIRPESYGNGYSSGDSYSLVLESQYMEEDTYEEAETKLLEQFGGKVYGNYTILPVYEMKKINE